MCYSKKYLPPAQRKEINSDLKDEEFFEIFEKFEDYEKVQDDFHKTLIKKIKKSMFCPGKDFMNKIGIQKCVRVMP